MGARRNNGYADWQPLRALDPYPRPGGATPLRVPLVPVYAQCTSPNTDHVAPLSSPSCTPPATPSSLLTTSSTGKGQGQVRFDVQPGDPLTATDEADVAIQASISDVRSTSDGSDYAGKLILNTTLRITDRASGFGGVSATTGDFGFSMPLDCMATLDPALGRRLQPADERRHAAAGHRQGRKASGDRLAPDPDAGRRRRRPDRLLGLPAHLRHRRRATVRAPGRIRALGAAYKNRSSARGRSSAAAPGPSGSLT